MIQTENPLFNTTKNTVVILLTSNAQQECYEKKYPIKLHEVQCSDIMDMNSGLGSGDVNFNL